MLLTALYRYSDMTVAVSSRCSGVQFFTLEEFLSRKTQGQDPGGKDRWCPRPGGRKAPDPGPLLPPSPAVAPDPPESCSCPRLGVTWGAAGRGPGRGFYRKAIAVAGVVCFPVERAGVVAGPAGLAVESARPVLPLAELASAELLHREAVTRGVLGAARPADAGRGCGHRLRASVSSFHFIGDQRVPCKLKKSYLF